MITSLITSLARVTIFWYALGLLIMFIGDPDWAETAYSRLMHYPGVPHIEMHGLGTAATVQFHLLAYWTLPVLLLWAIALLVGYAVIEVRFQLQQKNQKVQLKPRGLFWGVTVAGYSLGALPMATVPKLTGEKVAFATDGEAKRDVAAVQVKGAMKEAVKMLTPAERQLSEELLQLLLADPNHFAGLGHGVGLLEHTLNVVTEAAAKCTPEFRMPLLAALAHDVGKLVTFKPDGKGGWKRQGLHSRESARILATLPGFQELPEMHQRALILAVKYDHAPSKIPELRGEREATQLAMRTISALAHADRTATAAEKDRNLEKLQPEDLLWKDFVDYLREAPVVQRGKKGVANQVNNPPDSEYLFIYEAQWRDEAVRRMPPEVAAALDLTRRDAGKLAKYTRILIERLRKEGLLVEQHGEMAVSDVNPLWDIQSGTGEKAVVFRGILVLHAEPLWKKLNYRLSVKSPFPVKILAPNADSDGNVSVAPSANRDTPSLPDVSDGIKLTDIASTDAMAALGLSDSPPPALVEEGRQPPVASSKPKVRSRAHFRAPTPPAEDDSLFGLTSAPAKPAKATTAPDVLKAEAATPQAHVEGEPDMGDVAAWLEAQAEPAISEAESTDTALALLAGLGAIAAEPVELSVPEPAQTPTATPPVELATEEKPQPSATEPAKAELSRAEKREGLAIADEAVVATYPHLKVGDKYYTEHSRAVQSGLKKPGSRYKGDSKEKDLGLSETGPRRAKRRVIT